ncbi:MAG: hypothetical protein L0Y50_02025 [Beijerinckiaceae bacterium]|nr:hypothetical protein [Beijerinckiaceae bacterium]MCI0735045.1 hypothetical protein [Beijerinckiaceae bacterium]
MPAPDAAIKAGGKYLLTVNGEDVMGISVTYTGTVIAGAPKPDTPPGKPMAGETITGSTGKAATLSP